MCKCANMPMRKLKSVTVIRHLHICRFANLPINQGHMIEHDGKTVVIFYFSFYYCSI